MVRAAAISLGRAKALCAQVADRLNKMRWPIDPQLPKIGDLMSEWVGTLQP